jgi:hypothetical protein
MPSCSPSYIDLASAAAAKIKASKGWLTDNATQPCWNDDHDWLKISADDWCIPADNTNRDFIAKSLNHAFARNIADPFDMLLHVTQTMRDWNVYSEGAVSMLDIGIVNNHGDAGEQVLLDHVAACKKQFLREAREHKAFIEQLGVDARLAADRVIQAELVEIRAGVRLEIESLKAAGVGHYH